MSPAAIEIEAEEVGEFFVLKFAVEPIANWFGDKAGFENFAGVGVFLSDCIPKQLVFARSAAAGAVFDLDQPENEFAVLDESANEVATLEADFGIVGRTFMLGEQVNVGIHRDKDSSFEVPFLLEEQPGEGEADDFFRILGIVD